LAPVVVGEFSGGVGSDLGGFGPGGESRHFGFVPGPQGGELGLVQRVSRLLGGADRPGDLRPGRLELASQSSYLVF
jgi:hypothetical protein